MTDLSNPGLELATALEGIEQLKRERAEYQHEWKRSMERLQGDVARLRGEIISGQKRLFEPEPVQCAADETKPGAYLACPPQIHPTLMSDILKYCRKMGIASTRAISEDFKISPSAAVAIIDEFDSKGLLLPAEGSGPRKFREGA